MDAVTCEVGEGTNRPMLQCEAGKDRCLSGTYERRDVKLGTSQVVTLSGCTTITRCLETPVNLNQVTCSDIQKGLDQSIVQQGGKKQALNCNFKCSACQIVLNLKVMVVLLFAVILHSFFN